MRVTSPETAWSLHSDGVAFRSQETAPLVDFADREATEAAVTFILPDDDSKLAVSAWLRSALILPEVVSTPCYRVFVCMTIQAYQIAFQSRSFFSSWSTSSNSVFHFRILTPLYRAGHPKQTFQSNRLGKEAFLLRKRDKLFIPFLLCAAPDNGALDADTPDIPHRMRWSDSAPPAESAGAALRLQKQ